MNVILLFAALTLVQAALIHFHHFSPFEKEGNLRAVLWGAPPTARYAAVLVAELCAGLLLFLLTLAMVPAARGVDPRARAVGLLPLWIALTLLAAVAHHFVNAAVIRFPNYPMMARRFGAAFAAGIALCTGVAWFAAQAAGRAVAPDTLAAAVLWLVLLAVPVAAVRALAFLLRLVPLAGEWLHAALSTLMLAAFFSAAGGMLSLAGAAEPGLAGLDLAVIAVLAVAVAALAAAWRLDPNIRHAGADDPPPLVALEMERTDAKAELTAEGATLNSSRLRVTVRRAPFALTVRNDAGETLLRVQDGGLTREWFLHKILSIPVLYTGNTMKFTRRLGGESLGPVIDVRALDGGLTVILRGAELQLALHNGDVLHMRLAATGRAPLLGRFRPLGFAFVEPESTHYLGFGQRFNKVDQKGEDTYFLIEEGGVGYEWAARRWPFLRPLLRRLYGARGSFPNGDHCTGFPVPFCLLAREQGATSGLFWATYRPSWASVGKPASGGRQTRVSVLDSAVDLYLCAGPSPLDVVRQYNALAGRSEPVVPWALLPWKTRTGPVTENDTIEDIHRFRELNIPLAQVGIEHWQDIRGSYEFSQAWYPHIDGLIKEAKDNGYRITIWHFPYMNAGAATHRAGVQNGYFLRNRLGLPYQQRIFHGIATVVDYANPEAARWHAAIVRKAFHERGIDGAMTDYAESVPPDCMTYSGQSGLHMRNAYPVMYVRAMREAARGALGDDHIIYPRAGYAGSQRFITLQWPGDQDTDWDEGDGLPAAVRAMLNVSMCGFPIHGSDIGGWYDWFAPITTKDLYLRWAEVGAYSPLMRAHGGPIGRNREPWKFDDETVRIYRALSEEHVRMFPYWHSLNVLAARTGTPPVRHPALLWPHVAELYAIEDSWLIGDALYVAPVIRPGVTRRAVRLPPGEWWDLQADAPVQGDQRITVDAPYGRVPLFLRRGCILPRFVHSFDCFDSEAAVRDGLPHVTAKRPPSVGTLNGDLEIWLYPGKEAASFELFDGMQLTCGPDGWRVKPPAGGSPRKVTWHLFGTPPAGR